ncbi:MAG: LytR family transcriptional regulator, partial [Roseiflexus sp.]|nr:LytR family transcriptional regulator [Roseiflexus sp.]
MNELYENEPRDRRSRNRAYTGDTIVMRRCAPVTAPPPRRSIWRRIRRALLAGVVLMALLIALAYWQFAAAVAPL